MKFSDLRRLIIKYFDRSEFSVLCYDLAELDYDSDLPGKTRAEKVKDLIEYCKRHDKLAELLALLVARRPNVKWPTIDELKDNASEDTLLHSNSTSGGEDAIKPSIFDQIRTNRELQIALILLFLIIFIGAGYFGWRQLQSPIAQVTPTLTSTPTSLTGTQTPNFSTATPTITSTPSPSPSPTETVPPIVPVTNTSTSTPTPTHTPTPSLTPTAVTPTDTPTITLTPSLTPTPTITPSPTPIRHTIAVEETLQTISQRYYGRPDRDEEICVANRDRLPLDCKAVVGRNLIIPKLLPPDHFLDPALFTIAVQCTSGDDCDIFDPNLSTQLWTLWDVANHFYGRGGYYWQEICVFNRDLIGSSCQQAGQLRLDIPTLLLATAVAPTNTPAPIPPTNTPAPIPSTPTPNSYP